jgi:hypothetical protein
VQAKGTDPRVVLGKLLAYIHRVSWGPDLVLCTHVWPPPQTAPTTAAQYEALPEDSPWRTGPWLEELGLSVRETLRGWTAPESPTWPSNGVGSRSSVAGQRPRNLRSLIRDLVALARRAREAGDQLCCWTCL